MNLNYIKKTFKLHIPQAKKNTGHLLIHKLQNLKTNVFVINN